MRCSSSVLLKSSLISALCGHSWYGWSASSILAVTSLVHSSRLLVLKRILETDGANPKSWVLFCFSSSGNSLGSIRGSTCLKYRYRSLTFLINEGDCRHCFRTGLSLLLATSCVLVSSWLFLIADSKMSSLAVYSCDVKVCVSSEASSWSLSCWHGVLFYLCGSLCCSLCEALPNIPLLGRLVRVAH